MATIPNTRGNPQASDVAVQTALPMVGSASREDLQATLGFVDAELAKLFEDRNIQIVDGGLISYLGTSVEFTQPLKLHINSKVAGGSPTVVDLTATTRNFPNDGDMWYITLNRGAGTATHTIAATLPAVTSADQEIILIAKRSDSADGLKRLYFRNGSGYDEGQTARLGSSGSGAGDANSLLETFKNRLVDSNYTLMTPYVTAMDNDDLLDVGNSTATYSLVDKTINFTGIGQVARTIQLADANEFLNNTDALTQVELMAQWRLANIDTGATYHITRNGSAGSPDWQAITMSRVGSTDLYRGVLTFADEATNQALHSPAISGDLNASNELSASFTISSGTKQLLKKVVLNLTKTGSPAGNFFVSICADNAGSPGTVLSESNAVVASSVSTGNNTIDIPDLYLAAGTYHVKVRTDAAYKASYVNGVTELNLSSSSVEGITIDLRVRVTSSINTAKLEGLGLFYNLDANSISTSTPKQQETFTFTGASNTYNFTITKFIPDPDLLKVYDVNTGQVYTNGAFSVSGQVVSFTSGQFLSSDAYVTLMFDQTIGGSFDNSDVNQLEIDQLQEAISDLNFVSVPKIAAPYSTIVNRAQIPDLSQDLKPRMGVERIMTQQIYQLQDEFGPNGQPVWGVLNDRDGLIRFVGTWGAVNNTSGQRILSIVLNDYVEVTFYGTGLNLLTLAWNSNLDLRVSVDGGAESANIYPASLSPVLNGRNYTMNSVINVASGLTLGIHTVKLRVANTVVNAEICGFEILNVSSLVKTNPGTAFINGKKAILQQQDSYAYDSIVTGTKGGRVVEYLNANGTIGEAFQAVDASQLNLTAANHANEEVIRTYHWREFGAGRTDDFSQLGATLSARVFTLDDGTTTLTGFNVVTGSGEYLDFSNGSTITLTFVGTGLDIVGFPGSATIASVTVDNTSIGNYTRTSGGVTKIVSGLPYGTHVVRFTNTSGGTASLCRQFIVYGPKKPAIPTGAIELADYNVMANFVANTTAGILTVATGVLRKAITREHVYVNGTGGTEDWIIDALPNTDSVVGFNTYSNRTNAYVEYTFFGTGFDLRHIANTAHSSNVGVTLNGTALTTANFGTATFSTYGGSNYNATTAVLDTNDSNVSGSGFRVSGLPLALYRVRFNNTVASARFLIQAFDIITPIHSPKSNLYGDIQNTLTVGSCGISDNRKTDPLQHVKTLTSKAWAQAMNVVSNPSTTSTSFIPLADMSLTLKTTGNPVDIEYDISFGTSVAGQAAQFQIYVNGVAVGNARILSCHAPTYAVMASDSITVPLPAGTHKIDVYFHANAGGNTAYGYNRILRAREQ